MAIGIVATLEIKPGSNAEFEAIFTELAELVRANEPGNHFYALHRSRDSETTYVVLEQYADKQRSMSTTSLNTSSASVLPWVLTWREDRPSNY